MRRTRRYAQASDAGDDSEIDRDQAVNHVQPFVQHAPPEMQQQAYGQYVGQMPPDQRQQFVQHLPPEMQGQMDPNDPQGMAQSMQQVAQQNPNVLQQVWNNPLGTVVGIAGFAAKEILSHR